MTEDELKDRTKAFALRVMRVVDALPRSTSGRAVAGQLVRSGTSVAANYRAACRARSTADFVNKLAIVEEEADETSFWIELLMESGMVSKAKLTALHDESQQIVAIMVASQKTSRRSINPKSKLKNLK